MAAKKTTTRIVKINEHGRRIGEAQPRAKLTDHEIDLIRELVAEMLAEGLTQAQAHRRIAEKFDVQAARR